MRRFEPLASLGKIYAFFFWNLCKNMAISTAFIFSVLRARYFYQRLDLIRCILKGPPNIWLYELVRKCDGKEDEKCVNLWLTNSSFFTQNNKYMPLISIKQSRMHLISQSWIHIYHIIYEHHEIYNFVMICG